MTDPCRQFVGPRWQKVCHACGKPRLEHELTDVPLVRVERKRHSLELAHWNCADHSCGGQNQLTMDRCVWCGQPRD